MAKALPQVAGTHAIGAPAIPLPLLQRYVENRYKLVFFSLLLTLVVNPLLPILEIDAHWLTWFVAVNVLAAVFGAVDGAGRKGVMVLVTLAAFVISNLPETVAARWVTATALVCWMLFTGFAIAVSVRFSMKQDDVGSEHVYAALSSYLLAGVLFAMLYLAIERTVPGSLGPAGATTPMALSPDAAMYFSFVTLATLGYGDIVPLSHLMRGVAVVEAVTGQLYIAVLVASLISSYTQSRATPAGTPAP